MSKKFKSCAYFQISLFVLTMMMAPGCAGLRYVPPRSEPIVRVGIVQEVESFVFEPSGPLHVLAQTERQRFSTDIEGAWQVSISQVKPARVVYRCILYESDDRARANESAMAWRQKGQTVDVIVRGDELKAGNRTIVDHRSYAVALSAEFKQQAEAKAHLKSVFAGASSGRVFREILTPASGIITLISPDKKIHTVDNGMRLVSPAIRIENIKVGQGFHWERTESRTYGGELEITISPEGYLSIVNVLPMELYLAGVVAGEMPASFPVEALKAQAIVSRTVFLHHFGRVHRDDDYDVCDDVHCQAFSGLSESSEAVKNAVYTTRGLVLTYRDQLCEASYSAVCGGHTENAVNVWNGSDEPYLRGRLDTFEPLRGFDLQDEANVRLWVESEPRVCCNMRDAGYPTFARYAEKYFRWQQSWSRTELEKIISEKTGQKFGHLRDLIPVSRGVSGRIKELQIVGTQKSFSIHKELNIRRALSPSALYSACFVVEKSNVVNGLPGRFLFKGAGWGHGVGMCQVGAAIRAREGKTVNEILDFYYTGVRITQVY
ncbi:SpoIID/LytB domain-containing protein [candidate division KSB1 bacterium]|nr:SpoIID/LytB domain-containing protein [candidate division KSB1 bacterium]